MTKDDLIERLAQEMYAGQHVMPWDGWDNEPEWVHGAYRGRATSLLPVMAGFVAEWLDTHYQQDGADSDFLIFRWKREMTA